MARKTYKSPIFFSGELPVGEDPTIVLTPSQGSSGYDNQWDLSGISAADRAMIEANDCDDFDFKDMDANGDYVITQAEFDAWLADRSGW